MKLLMGCIMAAVVFLTGSNRAYSADTFIIGVAPHTSARVILEMYQPLRQYLEKALGCPVDIVTAPDFDEFARRGLAQNYDIAITTGHQARLFQTDSGYIPLLTYKADFKAVAVVAADSTLRRPAELNGKSVLGLSSTSLVTLWGEQWLKKNKVANLPIRYVSASDSVAQLVAAGEAAAGFTSLANFQKLTPELRSKLKIFATSESMAGRVYLLNSRKKSDRSRIDKALWAFADTPEAARYFETSKLEGYRKLKSNELKKMDGFAAEVRKTLHSRTQ